MTIWEWFTGLVCVAAIALLISAGVIDVGGRNKEDHVGPVPAGVSEISADTYLIARSSAAAPESICLGHYQSHKAIEKVLRPEALEGALYVRCNKRQTWDSTKGPSPNYGEGMTRTLSSPAWYAPVGALLLLWTVTSGVALRRDALATRRQREKVHMDLEQERRELRAAWAKDQIDDTTFHLKMDKLYGKGLEPAKDD